MKIKAHNDEWFAAQEERLRQDPTANTVRYYTRSSTIKLVIGCVCLLPSLFVTSILIHKGRIERRDVKKYLQQFIEWQNDCLNKGRTVTFDGAPGAGKTFSGANIAYELARRRWADLQSDYILQRTMLARWVKSGEIDKLSEFKALEEAYTFYKEREDKYIPCLFSSIPLKEYVTGRFSYKLEPEMFLQIKKVPVYTVLFSDELGQIFGNDKSYSQNTDFSDLWRFIRHFFDGMAVNTNQAADQAAIQARRSTDYVNHLFGQQWVMEPVELEAKNAKKELKYYKMLASGKVPPSKLQYYGQEIYYLKKYARTIGFRRVTHQLKTNEGALIGEQEEYIFPALGGVMYDDRCFRELYKCKDIQIEAAGWDKLTVDAYDRAEYDELVMKDKKKGATASKRSSLK